MTDRAPFGYHPTPNLGPWLNAKWSRPWVYDCPQSHSKVLRTFEDQQTYYMLRLKKWLTNLALEKSSQHLLWFSVPFSYNLSPLSLQLVLEGTCRTQHHLIGGRFIQWFTCRDSVCASRTAAGPAGGAFAWRLCSFFSFFSFLSCCSRTSCSCCW